jgi:catechol 2,3-dioxygenase-like lactoylglutathione lyase family enzyme
VGELRQDQVAKSARPSRIQCRTVIAGAHVLIYAEDANAARAFFRDVLGFRSVDAGEGWLIFALPPAELGIHPGPGILPSRAVGAHELFLMCQNIERTVADLASKGVEFVAPVADEGFGLTTRFRIPGGGEIGLYEPKHASPLAEFDST